MRAADTEKGEGAAGHPPPIFLRPALPDGDQYTRFLGLMYSISSVSV